MVDVCTKIPNFKVKYLKFLPIIAGILYVLIKLNTQVDKTPSNLLIHAYPEIVKNAPLSTDNKKWRLIAIAATFCNMANLL
jgi:hypothetical protein